MSPGPVAICNGCPTAFLVYDRSLITNSKPFFDWLEKEGYSFGGYGGSYNCGWVYISITRKLYAYGKVGIALVPPVGMHAITMDEFMTIYNIYKKYEGKEPLSFNSIDRD